MDFGATASGGAFDRAAIVASCPGAGGAGEGAESDGMGSLISGGRCGINHFGYGFVCLT